MSCRGIEFKQPSAPRFDHLCKRSALNINFLEGEDIDERLPQGKIRRYQNLNTKPSDVIFRCLWDLFEAVKQRRPGYTERNLRDGCQMAIARFVDRMCLALRASGLWLRYAALQNLIPSSSFHWVVPPRPPPWRNPRKGRDQILQCSVAEP